MLYLIRHGRTAANAMGLLQGRLDPPLDETGRAQAEAIARRIGPVDVVISSPLERARETASYFTVRDGGEVRVDDRWIEIAYGEYEGMAFDEVPRQVWERWRVDHEFATEGGESFGTLDRRVRGACDELIPLIADQDVAVVTHVSPIKAAVAWTLGTGLDLMFRCHLSQASVCRVAMGQFGPVMHSFNEPAEVP